MLTMLRVEFVEQAACRLVVGGRCCWDHAFFEHGLAQSCAFIRGRNHIYSIVTQDGSAAQITDTSLVSTSLDTITPSALASCGTFGISNFDAEFELASISRKGARRQFAFDIDRRTRHTTGARSGRRFEKVASS